MPCRTPLLVRLAAGLVVALLAALMAPVAAAQTFPDTDLTTRRISGANRIATSVAISQTFFAAGTTEVVLATAAAYPDALAAGPLARALDAPILLTSTSTLAPAVRTEIGRLGAGRVTIVGGASAVSPAVAAEVAGLGIVVDRISGADRFETSAAVARAMVARGGDVAVVRGWDVRPGDGFVDALSAASLGMDGSSVGSLLVMPDALPRATADVLGALAPRSTTVLGGTAAVSADVYGTIDRLVGDVRRVSGVDRYSTSVRAAEAAEAGGTPPSTLIFATGQAFPDSVVAGSLTGRLGAPLLLVPTLLPTGDGSPGERLAAHLPDLGQYLADRCESIETAVVVGGTSAVSAPMLNAIEELVTCEADGGGSGGGGGGGGGGTAPPSTTTSTVPSTSTTVPPTTTTVPPTGPLSSLADPAAGQLTAPIDTARSWTTGASPGQSGVDPDVLDPRRVALASGRVLDRSGAPLAGVAVRVAGSPELGTTTTNDDGEYLIALNGGAEVVLDYSMSGLLPVQRRLDLAWGDWTDVPDVVLIARDAEATTIDPATGGTHQASEVEDDDGVRAARVYVPAGTTASMVFDGAPSQPLAQMTLSITEFTVGALGPAAMPGDLPPSIAYTYAAEVAVAEADAAGAVRVDLSRPASMYLDNFLGMPVGTSVPLGFYEGDVSVWVPSPDGLVIEVLGEAGGAAELDIDGDGSADGAGDLADIGIDDDELAVIADQFDADDTFWRVQLPHFSRPDLNYPQGPKQPTPPPPPAPDPTEPDPDDPTPTEEDEDGFGRLRLESGALVERLPIVGTPYSLVHASDRVPGRHAHLEVQVWDDRVIEGDAYLEEELLGAYAELIVAGRTFRQHLTPDEIEPHQRLTFTWDGLDRYGRRLVGTQMATLRVVHQYKGYYLVPSDRAASFGVTPTSQPTTPVPSRTPQNVAATVRMAMEAATWDATGLGLGGWGVSVNHAYDPISHTVHMGDGSSRAAPVVGGELTLIGGNNNNNDTGRFDCLDITPTDPCGDGGPAVDAVFTDIRGTEAAPDGAIFVLDHDGLRVRRIDPDGTVDAFAGSGHRESGECVMDDPDDNDRPDGPSEGPCGDGGPAVDAILQASDVAVGRDGTVYLGDVLTNRVRAVAPDGTISTIVGTGEVCPADEQCGDGGPAIDAVLGETMPDNSCWTQPRISVSVGPDDSLWVEHGARNRVRRVGTDGVIETVLRDEEVCESIAQNMSARPGTGTLVREPFSSGTSELVPLSFVGAGDEPSVISDMLVRSDGTLVVVDINGSECPVILALDPGGVISRIAGADPDELDGCGSPSRGHDGDPAISTPIRPLFLAESPDGSLIVSTGTQIEHTSSTGAGVRRIAPDGTITTIVPWDRAVYELPSPGDLVLQAENDGRAIMTTVMPDGTVVVAHRGYAHSEAPVAARIMSVGSPLPGFGESELTVPHPSGQVIDVFDGRGRHLRTVSALSGATIYEFGYDTDGRLLTITDGDGQVTSVNRGGDGGPLSIEGPFGHTTTLALDTNGWLASVQEPTGATTSLGADPEGGQLLSITGARPGTTYEFAYDPAGRLVEASTPETGTTTLGRTRSGNTTTYTSTGPDGAAHTVAVTPLKSGGIHRRTTDAAGLVTTTVQNDDGTVTTTAPDGTTTTTEPGLDPRFGAASAYVARSEATTPGGRTLVVEVERTAALHGDGTLDNLTETVTVDGDTTTTVFDADSDTRTTTTPQGRATTTVLDDLGRPLRIEGTGVAPVVFTRDGLGRIAQVTEGTGPEARTITRSYDAATGHLISETNAEGETTTYETDANGRVTAIVRPDLERVEITLDEAGNRTSITPPGGGTHLQGYDLEGNITSHVAPDAGDGPATTSRTIGAGGELTGLDRADGDDVSFTYAGRRYTGRSGDALPSNWSYDPSTGQLVTAAAEATTTLAWDGSLLLEESTAIASTSITGTISRTYDDRLRVATETVAGHTVSTAYDTDGLLTAIGDQTIARDAAGRATTRTVGDTTVTTTYDQFGQITGTTAAHPTAGTLFDEVITRDELGRVIARTETIDGDTSVWAYGYDDLGRLTSVTEDGVERTYSYDANGNLVAGPNGAGTYDVRDRVEAVGTDTFGFDAAGDLISATVGGDTTLFEYDGAGLLRGVDVAGGAEVGHLHDGFDRRVARTVDGSLDAAWIYDMAGRVVAEYDGDGALTSRFVYATSATLPDYVVRDGEPQMIVRDWRGSPRLVVAAGGTVAQRVDHDELGAITADTNPGYLPFGFRGGLIEPHTGLVRFGSRDYDPRLGRFTTSDPSLFAGGQANLYLFAGGDPVNRVDPSGRGPSEPDGPTSCPVPGSSGGPVTDGVGVGGNLSLGTFGVGASAGVASDGKRPAIQLTVSGGVGVSTGGKVSLTGYSSQSEGELSSGGSYYTSAGGSGGMIVGGGVELTQDTAGNNGTITTAGVMAGAEAHANGNLTLTITGPDYDPQPGAAEGAYDAHYSDWGGCK